MKYAATLLALLILLVPAHAGFQDNGNPEPDLEVYWDNHIPSTATKSVLEIWQGLDRLAVADVGPYSCRIGLFLPEGWYAIRVKLYEGVWVPPANGNPGYYHWPYDVETAPIYRDGGFHSVYVTDGWPLFNQPLNLRPADWSNPQMLQGHIYEMWSVDKQPGSTWGNLWGKVLVIEQRHTPSTGSSWPQYVYELDCMLNVVADGIRLTTPYSTSANMGYHTKLRGTITQGYCLNFWAPPIFP